MSSKDNQPFEPLSLPLLSDNPLVSVLIANYNYEDYVGAAIESVLNQNYPNFELIICDDGSTDGSVEVIKSYIDGDPRGHLVEKENGGVSSALNAAYLFSLGDIICLLDSDDVFEPKKIEQIMNCFRQNVNSGLCMNQVVRVSAQGDILSVPYPRKTDIGWVAPLAMEQGGRTSQPPASGLSFRREVTDLIFPIPTSLKALADGYLAECASFLTEVSAVYEPLTLQRLHGANITGSISVDARTIQKTHADYVKLIHAVNDFLVQRYEMRDCLRLQDRPGYWDGVLALRLLGSREEYTFSQSFSVSEIIAHKITPKRRPIWRSLFDLPAFLSRWVLGVWWGYSWPKRLWKRIKRRFSPATPDDL